MQQLEHVKKKQESARFAEELSEAQASAERGGYHIVTWSEGSRFAVCNRLMNFPEGAPAEEKSRGIGAAHAEYWYMK